MNLLITFEIEKANDRARKMELLEYVRVVDTIMNDINSEEIAKIAYQNYEEELASMYEEED